MRVKITGVSILLKEERKAWTIITLFLWEDTICFMTIFMMYLLECTLGMSRPGGLLFYWVEATRTVLWVKREGTEREVGIKKIAFYFAYWSSGAYYSWSTVISAIGNISNECLSWIWVSWNIHSSPFHQECGRVRRGNSRYYTQESA